MASPDVFYFSYTRAYTLPVWLCSLLGSVRLRSLRSPLLGIAYYMRVFVRVSFVIFPNVTTFAANTLCWRSVPVAAALLQEHTLVAAALPVIRQCKSAIAAFIVYYANNFVGHRYVVSCFSIVHSLKWRHRSPLYSNIKRPVILHFPAQG